MPFSQSISSAFVQLYLARCLCCFQIDVPHAFTLGLTATLDLVTSLKEKTSGWCCERGNMLRKKCYKMAYKKFGNKHHCFQHPWGFFLFFPPRDTSCDMIEFRGRLYIVWNIHSSRTWEHEYTNTDTSTNLTSILKNIILPCPNLLCPYYNFYLSYIYHSLTFSNRFILIRVLVDLKPILRTMGARPEIPPGWNTNSSHQTMRKHIYTPSHTFCQLILTNPPITMFLGGRGKI